MLEYFTKLHDTANALILVVCISAALKIGLLLFNVPFNSDGVLYITAAQHFAAGNFAEALSVYPMPLYPLMIAGFHFLVPDWEIAGKLTSLACQILALIPLYFLTARLFSRKAAFWASLAFAVAPLPNDWAVDVIRSPAFVFSVLLAVYYAQKAIDLKKPVLFFLSALFSYCSFLFRVEGAIVVLFCSLYFVYRILVQGEERISLLKGFTAWLGVTVMVAGICFLAVHIDGQRLNRLDEVAVKAAHILKLDFLDNYHIIYEQLDDLGKRHPHLDRRQNLAEVTRHFMFLVYLLGEAQIFIKVLFPLFIVPFIVGLRRSRDFDTSRSFLFFLLCFYLTVMYVLYIDRNYLQRRFLFAPAALAFPWVGLGLERMYARLLGASRPKLYLAVFVIVFFISPAFKAVHSSATTDNVLRRAGNWVKQNELVHDARYFVNDLRAPFFAGIKTGNYVQINEKNKYNFKAIERFAIKQELDILFLKVPKRLDTSVPDISRYKRLKKFTGKERNVYIYCAPALCHE